MLNGHIAAVFNPLAVVMPAARGTGAVFESQHDHLCIAGFTTRHLQRTRLPPQQRPVPPFLDGLQELGVFFLLIK